MKIRLQSDLHHEFFPPGKWGYSTENSQMDTVLVLAGDIDCNMADLSSFVATVAPFFRAVIFVPGNHEYYHSSIQSVQLALDEIKSFHGNFHWLNDENVHIDDTVFIGSTMWTDFRKEDSLIMEMARGRMNDYNYIYNEGVVLTPQDVLGFHNKSRAYLIEQLKHFKDKDEKIVIINHHSPSYQCQHADYRHSGDMNYCYYNNFDQLMLDYEPDLWLYGHTHASTWIEIGKTIVASNPHGYFQHSENPNWKHDFLINLNGEKPELK